MRDQDGRPFKIETLPMPPAVIHDGTRLPASYANFYIANGAVLMPTFDAPTDARRLRDAARLFPGRRSSRRPLDRPGLGPRLRPLPELSNTPHRFENYSAPFSQWHWINRFESILTTKLPLVVDPTSTNIFRFINRKS